MVSDIRTLLYIKCSTIIFMVGAVPLFLACLVSLRKSTDFTELPHLSPPFPLNLYLSLSLPPPPTAIHSFRQRVWNMIALVVISGAFTLGIALCSTQYSDWNVGLKYSVQHSRTSSAIERSWVRAHLRYISAQDVMPDILEIFCALDLLLKHELQCVKSQ